MGKGEKIKGYAYEDRVYAATEGLELAIKFHKVRLGVIGGVRTEAKAPDNSDVIATAKQFQAFILGDE